MLVELKDIVFPVIDDRAGGHSSAIQKPALFIKFMKCPFIIITEPIMVLA